MKKIISIIIFLSVALVSFGAINGQYGFEGTLPAFVRANGRGTIVLSEDKFKDGKTSLKFEWNGPVQLMFTNSADMEASMKVDGGGMILWIFSGKAKK